MALAVLLVAMEAEVGLTSFLRGLTVHPMASAEESVDVLLLLLLDLDFDGDNEHELPGIFDGGFSPDLFGILEAAEFELAAAGLGKFEK